MMRPPGFQIAVAPVVPARKSPGVTIPCHLLISWHLARHVSPDVKARRWIGWAGVIPDLDGAGLLVDAATRRTNLYEAWHHLAGHNFIAGA
jgi:hypothetical protein